MKGLRGFVVIAFIVLAMITASLAGARSQAPTAGVRLALVNVPDEVLQPLLPKFEAAAGLRATIVYTGRDPFSVAREGNADLVIAHYGHEGVEPFVTGGFGLWPHPVFANSLTLIGPSDDPARVRGLTDPVEAFKRIAQAKARFMVNASAGVKYAEDIIALHGKVTRPWAGYTDSKLEGPAAVRAAAEARAYVLFGLPPFLRFKREGEMKGLEALVIGSPLLQRIMVSVVVNGAKVQGVNAEAARRFEQFLLTAETQAAVEAFRYPDFPLQAWWAAGHHNSARE